MIGLVLLAWQIGAPDYRPYYYSPGYPKESPGCFVGVFDVTGTPVVETETYEAKINGEPTKFGRYVERVKVKVLDSWPDGYEGDHVLVISYGRNGMIGAQIPKGKERLFGVLQAPVEGKIFVPNHPGLSERDALEGELAAGPCFPYQWTQITTDETLGGAFYRNYFRGLKEMSALEFAYRLSSIREPFNFPYEEGHDFSSVPETLKDSLQKEHRILLDQVPEDDGLKRFILASAFVRWKVPGATHYFMDTLDGVASVSDLEKYVDLWHLDVRFMTGVERAERRLTTQGLLDQVDAVQSVALKYALIRAIQILGDQKARLAGHLKIQDERVRMHIIYRLASEMKMPEKAIDYQLEGEELSQHVEQLARFWMEYFGYSSGCPVDVATLEDVQRDSGVDMIEDEMIESFWGTSGIVDTDHSDQGTSPGGPA